MSENSCKVAGHIREMPDAWLQGAQFCTLPANVENGCRKELERRATLSQQEPKNVR